MTKIYLYVKNPYESKYQLLINKREKVGIKTKAFIDYSQTIDDVYEILEDYNLTKRRKALILNIGKNISYFKVPKTVRPNATYYFIMKIPNKRELQHIASNYFFDNEFKDSMKLYKDYTKEPFSVLMYDTTLTSDNPFRFRKN